VQRAPERRVTGLGLVGSVLERRTRRAADRRVERVVARRGPLEELAHDRPADRALELVADRSPAAEAAYVRQRAGVRDQSHLADAGGPFDDDEAARAGSRAIEGVSRARRRASARARADARQQLAHAQRPVATGL